MSDADNRLAVLALDLATSTGWAFVDRTGCVTSGVQVFELARGESTGMRFIRFRRWLREMLEVESGARLVDVIAYERAHHRGGAATALCVGLATVMLEEAARLGIETLPVATTTLKKAATGKGNAGKSEMIAAAIKRWPKHLAARGSSPGDDEADALCCLSWAMVECGVKDARVPG